MSSFEYRKLVNLLEDIESREDINDELSRLRKEFIALDDSEELDEKVDWKKLAATGAATAALGAGAAGASDAKAQNIGDFVKAAQAINSIAQQVQSNQQTQAPEAPVARQQVSQPSAQQQAAPRSEPQQSAPTVTTMGELMDLSNDAGFAGSCVQLLTNARTRNLQDNNSFNKMKRLKGSYLDAGKGQVKAAYLDGNHKTMMALKNASPELVQKAFNQCMK